MATKRDIADILVASRQATAAHVTTANKKKLLKDLQEAASDLRQRLTQAEGLKVTGKGTPFTEERLRMTLKQVKDVTAALGKNMKATLLDSGKVVAEKSSQGLIDYMRAADKNFTGIAQPLPLNEAFVFKRAVSGVNSSMLHRIEGDPRHPARPGIMRRYGDATVQNFEDVLSQSLITRADWYDTRNALIAESPFLEGAPASWAERIYRTETMHAYNRASWESMAEAQEELGDMLKILSAVFDDRTGWDSYQVHGQIRRTTEAFQYNGPKGPVLYQHPPNRPNDREIVIPHRMSWPLPPTVQQLGDEAVVAAWLREGRKGACPARPTMSTVDVKKIGQVPPPPLPEPAEEPSRGRRKPE